jgi:16S rRNA (uracil1498-N3)-methyltransferase
MTRSPFRFYYPAALPDEPGAVVELPEGESHHVLRVLRLKPGTPVTVFDKDGRQWSAEVAGRGEGEAARLTLIEAEAAPQAEGPEVSVAAALLKRRAMDWMIEKLSELNVASLQPLITERTVVEAPESSEGGAPARWERIALAAAKQCGRATPLGFAAPTPLTDWLKRERPRVLACFAHAGPGSTPLGVWLGDRAGMGLPVVVAVGPEGGWTPGEVEAFQAAGFSAVSLGPHVLRAETAALTVAAACRVMLQEY